MPDQTIICYQCQKELAPAKTQLSYLGISLTADILRCPKCGQVYIPEDLAKGRIAAVETQLEDK